MSSCRKIQDMSVVSEFEVVLTLTDLAYHT